MLEWFLFHTWPGERFLTWLERCAGLAVVRADWLGDQESDPAVVATGPQEAETLEWSPSVAARSSVTRLAEADN